MDHVMTKADMLADGVAIIFAYCAVRLFFWTRDPVVRLAIVGVTALALAGLLL